MIGAIESEKKFCSHYVIFFFVWRRTARGIISRARETRTTSWKNINLWMLMHFVFHDSWWIIFRCCILLFRVSLHFVRSDAFESASRPSIIALHSLQTDVEAKIRNHGGNMSTKEERKARRRNEWTRSVLLAETRNRGWWEKYAKMEEGRDLRRN